MTTPAAAPEPAPHPLGHVHVAEHSHAADLDTCLELVNTLEYEDGEPQEALPTADAAIAFLASRGIAHAEALEQQAAPDPLAWLTRVHDVRNALRQVWDGAVEQRPVRPEAAALLNDVLDHAPRRLVRPALASGVVVSHRHDVPDPTGEALARLAEPLLAAVSAGDTARFRVCANDGCRWVFEDTSRGGRRRWCDMSSCGNRAKVRRFRSRRRVPSGGPGDSLEAAPGGPDDPHDAAPSRAAPAAPES